MLQAVSWSAYLAWQLRGQKRVPFCDPAELRRCQSDRVRRMVSHAYNTVPYYRETMLRLRLTPEKFETAKDLAKLPVLERSELQRDPEYFVSRAVNTAKCLRLESSGSSGRPKTIWHDAASVFQNAAHGERERAMMVRALGRWSGHRETVMVSPFNASQRAVQDFVRANARLPRRMQVKRQYLLLSDPPEINLRLMNEFRPDLLYSYGSYIEMLVAHVRQTNADWHKPKAILYSSDHLAQPTREWIGELGIPVFTVYGSVEGLKIAFSCEQNSGLHLNSDLYAVRIVDEQGNEAEPGAAGDVILSNLVNRATVLLNYRLGDLACMLKQPCSCGRNLPLISHPLGRVDDIVELPNGSTVHPIVFRKICLHCPGILQYQVRQVQPAAFCVSLVAAPGANQQEITTVIQSGFRQEFSEAVMAEVRFVSEVERTRGGKTPAIIALRNRNMATAVDETVVKAVSHAHAVDNR